MDGTALILLVSGVGVGFGWQPMPDGSQGYEYVVQVEPEVASRLADGHSIPIVAEIPKEVQPIGRIRVVIGRDTLPRQRLVTHLKPAVDAGAVNADRVKLAQYNQYADPRYRAAPPDDNTWNNQPDASITPTDAAPPSGQQLFGQPQSAGDTWNNGTATAAVADATAGAFDRVSQEMQRAVAPVTNGLEKIDSQVRGAVGDLGQRTRGIVDELREPFNPQPPLPADARPTAGAAARAETAQAWNQDAAAPPTGNPLRTNVNPGGSGWNHEPADASQVAQPPATPPFATSQVGGDPWAGVPDPRNQGGAPQLANPNDAPSFGTRPMPFGGVGSNSQIPGPQFPPLGNPPATTPTGTAATSTPPAAVVGNMLKQPADRPLDGSPLSPTIAGTAPAPLASNPILQPATTARPWSVAPPATAATTAANPAAAANAPAATPPAGRDNTVAVLVAWVLLTGSIAGNMYLFWSYLDVRQKYRSLVRKTARAVGSRFSAA